MDATTDIELTISGLDTDQARDVWARINIIAAALIGDGWHVTVNRCTYAPKEDAE